MSSLHTEGGAGFRVRFDQLPWEFFLLIHFHHDWYGIQQCRGQKTAPRLFMKNQKLVFRLPENASLTVERSEK
jgi:hypothetical protein